MKKLLTKSVSVFLAMLLVMTSLTFNVFALDTDDEKAIAAPEAVAAADEAIYDDASASTVFAEETGDITTEEATYNSLADQYDAEVGNFTRIMTSWRVNGGTVSPMSGDVTTTYTNERGNFAILKVDLPALGNGQKYGKMIVRFAHSAGTNNNIAFKVEDIDVPNVSSIRDTDFYKTIIADRTAPAYIAYELANPVVTETATFANFHYVDITKWAQESYYAGKDYVYLAVGSWNSTANIIATTTTDGDYTRGKYFPGYWYSFEDVEAPAPLENTAEAMQALGNETLIRSTPYQSSGGNISAVTSAHWISTYISGRGNMAIVKVDLPEIPAGKTIGNFAFRYGVEGGGASNLRVFKMPGTNWNLNGSIKDTDWYKKVIDASTSKIYNANDNSIVYTAGANGSNGYTMAYANITSYIKECYAAGQTYCYLAYGDWDSTRNTGHYGITDSDWKAAGVRPLIYYSFADIGALGLVSSNVAHYSEDVAADKKITFTFASRIDSATALLNGKNAEVTIQGREVILKTPLAECSDYTLSIVATDMFGQEWTKTISFSTGFKDGKTEAETPVIGVYDIRYSINTVSNELLELSFSLLTKFANVNEAIEIREIGAGKTDAAFSFYAREGKYDLTAPVALTAGKSYEAVIKKGVSDIYGNKAADDVVIAKFFAGNTPDITVSGDGEELDTSLDVENASLSVYFKNPLYSNNEVTVTIESDDGNVYTETVTTGKRGVIAIYGIALPESGSYTLKIAPKSAPGVYEENISFYTESDILKYWEMVAVNGKATDIASDWANIEYVFDLSNEYSESISDISALASKIAAQRDNDFGEMTDEAIEELRRLVLGLSYFTAFEQSKTPDEAISLIDSESDGLSGVNKAICNEWSLALASEYAEDVKAALAGAEKTADSYEDIITVMDNALDSYRVKNLLKLIGEAQQRTEVSAIVSNAKNAELLGISDLLSRYNALDSTLDVDKALMKKFDSASDFVAAFEEALAQAEDNEDDDDEGGRGGSSSSSSKGSGGSNFHIASTIQIPQTVFNPFSDVENISWAKDHIIKLYNRGIINGKSTVSFAPYDNITREEFTKLISVMMQFTDNGAQNSFVDVDYSSWYAPYIKAAVSNGVCEGIGGGRFGVGLSATRQDIAVMIVNSLKAKGIVITEEIPAFNDNDKISDYAVSSVAFLNAKGVVFGDDASNFNPRSNVTRAEVAVMLSRAADIFSIK